MLAEPTLLDTDTLSELSRGHPAVTVRARAYLAEFARFTISAVTVFEGLRGYRRAIRAGKRFERQLQAFEALVAQCIVLPFDQDAADVAATILAAVPRARRTHLGDILIGAMAIARQLPLATRNRRDFRALSDASGLPLRLVDWATVAKRVSR